MVDLSRFDESYVRLPNELRNFLTNQNLVVLENHIVSVFHRKFSLVPTSKLTSVYKKRGFSNTIDLFVVELMTKNDLKEQLLNTYNNLAPEDHIDTLKSEIFVSEYTPITKFKNLRNERVNYLVKLGKGVIDRLFLPLFRTRVVDQEFFWKSENLWLGSVLLSINGEIFNCPYMSVKCENVLKDWFAFG